MIKQIDRKGNRLARHKRVRKKVQGTPERPRLAVFRSDKHLYVQVIDDINHKTIAQASTLDKSLGLDKTHNKEAAKKVGEAIGEKLKSMNIEEVVFDRGGYIYHGRVKELADGARSAGLKF